ncbi:VWA domain-containing protein [Vallicoccus soli]|uniref:VWA domain-containing protein n=1 Tax=Vallicoccus soli TaxID=2339232 RepID=A0A3A3Z168_9ACTN|nr:VWA domain-containing protein [Vallicoccus soli]RJK96995.1 VWA domain-containing protein [Vallicoccus soli]
MNPLTLSFEAPARLWLLLGVLALVVLYLLAQRRRRDYAVRFTALALLDKVAPRRPAWRRHVPAAAFLGCVALLVLAVARPEADTRVPRERASVIVAVDTSISMQATDVEPSRFAVAKEAAADFVDELPEDFAVGLVSFNGGATLEVAPTRDHEALAAAVQRLQLGPSTAIGEAVYASLAAIEAEAASVQGGDGTPAPARIVLLSDGTNTVGRGPEDAADAASEAGVPVSTIAYGTEDGVVETQGQLVPVPVDAEALAALAEATGGQAYEAATGDELGEVYDDIGASIGYRVERRDATTWFVGGALLLALAAAAGSLRWFARLP